MANFSNCLQIVNNMPERDQEALLSRLDELQAQGMSPTEAQLQAAIDVLAQVESEGQIRKSEDRGYVTEDEISKMYVKAWGDLKRDKKYIELSQAVEDAEAAGNERFQKVHRRAIEILKSRPGFSKIADEYDEKTIGNLARVFMDQADEDVPPASPSAQDAIRARQEYVDSYFKDVAKIPEPREFSGRANQQRDYYDTPSFKRWFKESKVVDAQGNPLVAFHVTSNDFVEFDTAAGSKAGKKTHAAYSGQLGSWFTAPSLYDGNYDAGNAEAAIEGFIEADDGAFKDGANTMLVHLSIQNPMEYSDFESMLEDRDSYKNIATYKKSLVDQGYDGIVIRNSDTDGGVDRDDWVAFEPTQIKSAIGNNGEFNPNEPSILKSVDRPQFYSQLQRAIEGVPARLDNMGAVAWKQWLTANASKLGVKAEEVEWSGIKDYLDLKGKAKLSKDELAAYLDDSGVKVSETELGRLTDSERVNTENWYATQMVDGWWEVVNPAVSDEPFIEVNPSSANSEQEAIASAAAGANENRQRASAYATKYGKYTLPGGENYRELLITLPSKNNVAGISPVQAARVLFKKEYSQLTEEQQQEVKRRISDEETTTPYMSSHWADPNVLAHIRVNDRTDADGKRVLFVEEVQSDWGQEGKKKGFNGKDPLAKSANGDWVYTRPDGVEVNLGPNIDEQMMRQGMAGNAGSVPSAPFVTKTEGWLNLALKRIAMMAVEGGYDKVAFVKGEQASDRFGLINEIGYVSYLPRGEGKPGLFEAWDNNRKQIFANQLLPEQLEEYIGKEVAERLLATKPVYGKHTLEGLDLKTGGEGMKTFYDQIVPQNLNKLLPKIGGEKLGKVGIDVGLNSSMSYEIAEKDDGRFALRARADANSLWAPYGVYDTKALAEERMSELKAESEASEQPGFNVTDKMRETVGQGLPLFSRDRVDADEDGQYDGNILFTVDRNYEPENTVTAYKLFRTDAKQPGKLFPLFVNANKEVPVGEWLKAEIGPMTGDKVKSKLGPLAFRPGWHAGDVPVATHIGMKDSVTDKAPKYRNPEHVWAEVEFADDVDWQEEANKRGTNSNGKLVPVKAHITDQIPARGFYRYKTNSNMTGNWLIGGEMRVTRILSDDEVKSINDAAGVADLPRKQPFDSAKYGFGSILKSADRPWFDDLAKLKVSTNYQLGDLLKTSKKLSWWDKTIGTQYNLAQKQPQFKRVFDAVQTFINDVSAYATHAADLAPNFLPKLESWKDIAKSPLSAADVKALRNPIFGGTLNYTRDEDGNIIETEDVSTAGVVFKDEELREMFGLNDRQIGLYREFRRATNKSLSDLAVSDMLRYLGTDGEGVRQRALDANNLDGALDAMVAHIDQLIEQNPKRAEVLENSKKAIKEKAGQAIGLMARGYAPLSRFGQYTVDVVDQNGERLYFSMFEDERDANKMARELQQQYPEATVQTGTMSQESYKLFSGVTPETLALFGESLGLEESSDDAKSQIFQEYLKAAKTNRSAMKRLIQRKGIDGFSEDAGRVLAGFVYSNARQISTNLHAGEIGRSAAAVTDGDVKDAAIKLMEYVQNPREEAQALRGLMFTQFIGGSIASAMVNMTQPFTMTLPYLSQFAGAIGAGKLMGDAVKLASRGVRNDEELASALKRAEDEGVVSPQEVHQLMAQAQGKGSLQSGDGTRAGDAAAKVNNSLAKLGLAWGKVFSAAEQFNRRVTFIAAYKMAREKGMENPFAFAENAIAETQGVYNKGNKPTWARGAVGGTLFTFKQYSIGYVEFLRRMWGNGPEGKKAVGLALGVLFLMSGLGGMPGADDLDDVIDGFLQRVLGRSFDTKQAKKEFFASILGQSGAEFVMSGLSGLPGMPIDVAGRMGLGNLIPGTGLLTKKRDYGRDYLEIAGPAGTLFTNAGLSVAALASGDVRKAAEVLSPVAIQNALKAKDMAEMGFYRDQKGRKVIDTDGYDVVAKALGFQPRAVAQVQEATGVQSNLITQNKLRETEIADKWAAGRIEKDPAKVDEAKQMLADWNRNNPESKISIDANQINKRVQEANKSKAQRVAATAPKEIRGAVKKELERVD